MIVIEIKDADLVEEIRRQAADAGMRNGVIVSLIGAVDRFTVSTMPAADPSADTITAYDLPGEITSAVGDIRNGTVHLHAGFGVEGDRVIGGHLHAAAVGRWFARAYVQPV
ncbi:MAG: PPC domain-containing DNA-binding protein [Pseudonocardia sp.]